MLASATKLPAFLQPLGKGSFFDHFQCLHKNLNE